jgi:hypothetical protein
MLQEQVEVKLTLTLQNLWFSLSLAVVYVGREEKRMNRQF